MTEQAQVVYVPITTVTEVLSVSQPTVRNWMRSGRIPEHTFFRVGKNFRFNLDEILRVFQESETSQYKKEPQPQPEAKQAVTEAPKKELQAPQPVQLQFDFDADLDI